MNVLKFHESFETMRKANLGKTFERRSLGLLALQYGIYFNSTMWACGLGDLFIKSRLGMKYVYTFKPVETKIEQINALSQEIFRYNHNDERKIEHARAILRRFGVGLD